ncbi:copper resistance system multicopper oxidase [Sphingopyxis sp. H115]|uniref:copper resistance system multicopper oxidase n=1 Tax=Sphingopyxis sp. H115 TaxID=1759073 RepID=UPI000736BC53|nr:copper resistance system multicopper oxidase [Sphingopyxis sp. H115]KTE16585.1 copper-binding protein [Sphingopyxis sp. H115]
MQIDRRRFVGGALGGGAAAALAPWFPAWAQPISHGIVSTLPTVSGSDITLRIARQTVRIDGKASRAIGINGTVPAPLVRLKEGQTARLTVVNDLDEDSSIHWHGLILPFYMDGVPGVSFPGIKPKSTFVYEFPVVQSGTYWYHSHSGLQEQLGHYGPIVIDPAEADPIGYDREHVILLSDHSRLSPEEIFRKLKVDPGHFNMQRQTLGGLLPGKDQPLKDRLEWGAMRMDPADIADVSGSTYSFLVNGHGPRDNWTGLFRPGERVRLRIINASAMSIFNVRIPGLRMTVVQADGVNIVPTQIDEFQIAVAETYDVIVNPVEDRAYTIAAEANDRSGMARATLTPRVGLVAEVPPLRERPLATMQDMGMVAMASGGDAPCAPEHAAMGHCVLPPADNAAADHAAKGHGSGGMKHSMRDFSVAPQVKRDPGVQTISPMPVDRMGEPGQGLEDAPHKVLTYHDLVALDRNPDVRAASRSIDIHLTGNMERFMWSFDGVKMSDHHEPIPFTLGERVRINLINDSMMSHPIHLHGHFFELVTGKGDRSPRKHTVLVQPGGTASFDFTADALGDWAFHCHLLYHMHAGMMRVVSVRPKGDAE